MNAFPADRIFHQRWREDRYNVIREIQTQLELLFYLDAQNAHCSRCAEPIRTLLVPLAAALPECLRRVQRCHEGKGTLTEDVGINLGVNWLQKVRLCQYCGAEHLHNRCSCGQWVCSGCGRWVSHITNCVVGRSLRRSQKD